MPPAPEHFFPSCIISTLGPAAVGAPKTFEGSFTLVGTQPVAYDWDFGDGEAASGPNPTHSYAAAGSHPVSLVVTDEDGGTTLAASRSS